MILDFERERGVEPRERTRALRGLGWSDDFGDIFPDQPSPSASSTRTTRSLRSAASASHSRGYSSRSAMLPRRRMVAVEELGQGGTVAVYEGQLARFGRVAIKRLESSGGQGEREFLAELEMLAGLRDARLVRLLGYAAEGDEKCLVYQYLAGGTLEARLHGTATAPMTWIHRLQCAVEVSQALYYLHHCAHRATNEAIVHGDIKSANILFDAAGAAKLADFGMARRMEGDLQHTMTLAGSKGYLDPHYITHGRLGPTSDVYSFGVVLLELLTAERRVPADAALSQFGRPLLLGGGRAARDPGRLAGRAFCLDEGLGRRRAALHPGRRRRAHDAGAVHRAARHVGVVESEQRRAAAAFPPRRRCRRASSPLLQRRGAARLLVPGPAAARTGRDPELR